MQIAIEDLSALMHEPPEVLRLKIKELVAEYAEPGDSSAGVIQHSEAPGVSSPKVGGLAPQPRFVP